MAQLIHDEPHMQRALAEARRALGLTHPNPAVGAVIARGDELLATGFHRRAGEPHAEIEALRGVAGRDLSDCTLYVTLEPCSTVGRTPACTDAIIAAGVGRVVFGAVDPNPRHVGRACAVLENAGIIVEQGILGAECEALNRPFNKWIRTGVPWVIAKVALTLDGQLVLGTRRWLSSRASRDLVQRYRREVDAVLVGSGTVRKDNPKLTVHRRLARQPLRVVWGRTVPADATVFTDSFRDRTIVLGVQSAEELLAELGRREVLSLMVEGGGATLGRLNDADAIDEIRFFLTPWISGGGTMMSGEGVSMGEGRHYAVSGYERVGSDVLVSAIRLRS